MMECYFSWHSLILAGVFAFNVDITNLLKFTQEHRISFYYSLIFLCTQALNQIDEFLMEIRNNRVLGLNGVSDALQTLRKARQVFIWYVFCARGISLSLQKSPRRKHKQSFADRRTGWAWGTTDYLFVHSMG